LLGKINYLRWFIANLADKVDSFLPLVRLKHEHEFRWGIKQEEAFGKIKQYMMSPPVLRAPKPCKECKLYVAAQERVIRAMLTQEDSGKEFMVVYAS
jgi:hypothetical protein